MLCFRLLSIVAKSFEPNKSFILGKNGWETEVLREQDLARSQPSPCLYFNINKDTDVIARNAVNTTLITN